VDEVNLTDGWRQNPEAVHNWCRRVHDFFQQHDYHGRPTAGTHSGARDAFWPEGCEIFSTASRELYGAHRYPCLKDQGIVPGKADPLRISYSAFAAEIQKLWRGYPSNGEPNLTAGRSSRSNSIGSWPGDPC